MKNKFIFIVAFIFLSLNLVACATGPVLMEEQSQQIANYSTALLLKYDGNYETRLVDTAMIEAERALIAEEQARIAAEEAALIAAEEAANLEEANEAEEETISAPIDVVLDIDDSLGIIGADIEYAYFEILDEYSIGESFAPVIPTVEGNRLFVVHFTLTNSTSEPFQVSIFDTKASFLLETNTMARKNTFITLLLNDFTNYEGIVESGEMLDLVLISEMMESETIGIEDVLLTMKINGETLTTKLQ